MTQKLKITLEPRSISACQSLPPELKFIGAALQHQIDVWNLAKNNDIILDLAPTGTGKTNASFTVLLHQPNKTAIYIAPTNALVTQQAKAAEKFIRDAGLPHLVKPASAREISSWRDDKVGKRRGEKLYNVLRNPATIFPEVGANKPLLLVTNPDIFYYATFLAYNHLDRGNIASQFYSKFATVIFDEFHLYDAKQLVSLLFYLAVSHVLGFFKNDRRVVLLTATPEPACERALETLEKLGVKIARVDGEENKSNLLPSQTAVSLEIRPQLDKEEWLQELADEVVKKYEEKPGENGAVILDSKDLVNRLADLLKGRGFDKRFGRITGSTPFFEREIAAGREVILATNTVDVGFNFEKSPPPERQNLDWLIFSANNRFSFWQRLGRVGRVLGKVKTDVVSEAIAYEFVEDGEFVELVGRAKDSYQISFYLRYYDSLEEFKNMELNKLSAFENCRVERRLGDAVSPTPLLKQLNKDLLPGVIIATAANMGVIIRLQKQGIASYKISVSANDGEKDYTFFPGLGGILAIALYGVVIKLADEEDFYIA